MARHRDVRNMDYADEYEGYDDVYGHSVDDDYYISPSNRQFIYNREASRESKFEHKDDIQEADEVDELSDVDRAKLNSCIDEIITTLEGPNITRSELAELVLKHKFDIESVINTILQDSKYQKTRDKDDTILCVNNSKTGQINAGGLFSNKSNKKSFVIPDIFGGTSKVEKSSNFNIPNIFGVDKQNSLKLSNTLIGNETKKFNIPNIFGSTSSNVENQAEILLPRKLNSLHFKSSPVKVQSVASTQAENSLNIDLTVALKATKSLPNFNKNKENQPEMFEMPYIDGDYQVENSQEAKQHIKRKVFPCTLNVSHLAREHVSLRAKASKFGRVLVRKYRKFKGSSKFFIHQQDLIIPKKVNVFKFNTLSPDDYINSHLSK